MRTLGLILTGTFLTITVIAISNHPDDPPPVAVTPYVITLSEGAKIGCYEERMLHGYFRSREVAEAVDPGGPCGFLSGTSKVRVERKHGARLCVFPVSEKGDGWDDVVVATRTWTPVNAARPPQHCVWVEGV